MTVVQCTVYAGGLTKLYMGNLNSQYLEYVLAKNYMYMFSTSASELVHCISECTCTGAPSVAMFGSELAGPHQLR